MTRYLRFAFRFAPLSFGLVASCQLVAGTGDRTLNPVNTSDTLPGVGDAGAPGELGRVRIADLAVTPGYVDWCIRVTGTTSWGEPIMRNSGTDSFFRTGLSYPQVTVPFAVPAGQIDVKFITAGELCASASLSEATGITVGNAVGSGDAGTGQAPVVTILRYGGNAGASGGIAETVVGLPEEPHTSPPATCTVGDCPAFRVVNAAAWTYDIDFGPTVGSVAAPPASVTQPVLATAISPGHVPGIQSAPPFSPVDVSGYVGAIDTGTGGQTGLTLGITANTSNPTNAYAIFEPSPNADVQTLFFIGAQGDNVHPLQGLLVEDRTAAASAAGAPGDAGVDYRFLAAAKLTTPPTISIDTINVALYGLPAPDEAARRSPILAALQLRTTDLMCITEVDEDSDKLAIEAAVAHGNFPHPYYLATDITTAPTSSTDWFGNTPPLLTTSACAPETPATVASIGTCASDCSVGGTGDEDAGISSTACLENQCIGPIGGLLYETPPDYACADCAIFYLTSEYPINEMVSECGSDSNDPYGQYGFAGQNATLLLSSFPFAQNADGTDDVETYLFPGSSYRRTMIRARLQLDPNTQVDFYCGQLISPDIGSEVLQYAGQYAAADAGMYPGQSAKDNGWEDEQNLQVADAIQWILKESGTTPAIIAGDWHSSLAYATDAGTPILDNHSPEIMQQLLDAGFTEAHPAGYVPTCQYCNSNPWVGASGVTSDDALGLDYTTTFLFNFAPNSTYGESIWDNDPTTWTIPLPDDAGMGPLSPYYPRVVQVFRP